MGLAIYAAVLATVVGLYQITSELPWVILTADLSRVDGHAKVTVVNVGRRPVVIAQAFSLDRWKLEPVEAGPWMGRTGRDDGTLAEGEFLEFGSNRPERLRRGRFVVRDVARKWWPRRRRPQMWVRAGIRWWRSLPR